MMKHPSAHSNEEAKRLQQVAKRFEQMLLPGEKNVYFDAEDLEDLFDLYLDKHQLYLADQVLKIAVTQHPQDNIFKLLKAEILIEMDMFVEALQVVDTYPLAEEPWWCYLRFRILAYLERFEEALRQAKQLLDLRWDIEEYTVDIALVLSDCGRMDLAYDYLLQAEKLQPDNAEVLTALGRCVLERGDGVQAEMFADKAIKVNPYMAAAWLLKGSVAVLKDRCDEALEAFEYVLAINPYDEMAWLVKTQTLLMADRVQEAEECVEYMVEQFPQRKDLLAALQADLAYVHQDYKQASAYYTKALKLGYSTSDMMWRFADCKWELHRWKDAAKLLELLRKDCPDDFKIPERLADIYVKQGNKQKALAMARLSMRLQPDNVSAYLSYAGVLILYEDYDNAYKVLRKAYKMDSERLETNLTLAIIHVLRNELDKVCSYLENAIRIHPDAKDIFYRMLPDAKNTIENYEQTQSGVKKNKSR